MEVWTCQQDNKHSFHLCSTGKWESGPTAFSVCAIKIIWQIALHDHLHGSNWLSMNTKKWETVDEIGIMKPKLYVLTNEVYLEICNFCRA